MKKVLGWAVRWSNDPKDKSGDGVDDWAAVTRAGGVPIHEAERQWVAREERTLLTKAEADAIVADLKQWNGEDELVATVRIVTESKPDKLEQAIAKIESVGARTREDLEDAKRDEEWSNVAAYHNQVLAEDNVLRILRGFR